MLSGELTIYSAVEVSGTLLAALQQAQQTAGPVQLDLAEVTELDGAGMQLLLSTAKSVAEWGATVSLSRVPPPIQAILDSYHLANRFTQATGDAS
jgi:anti-anti-sigma factor